MQRRSLLLSLATLATVPGWSQKKRPLPVQREGSFSVDGTVVRFFHPGITKRFTMVMLADTHLFRDDERGAAYTTYSSRMAKAYNKTTHFETKAPTHPEACFEATLQFAQKSEAELLALVGDIFSFPSEAAIEWVLDQLQQAQLPYLYVAGNHDWHYEGMAGTMDQLRATWIQKRLLPLYQNDNPMMMVRNLHGVRIVAIDNSDYQITESQLDFFRRQIATPGQPVVLLVHIPLYAPERSLGFGCGHPNWSAAADKSYTLERRPPWPKDGHTATTLQFHREVWASPQVIGILAGHTHRPSLDVVQGIPQLVTEANAQGGYLKVEFVPMERLAG